MGVWRVARVVCQECCCQIEKQYLIALCLLLILQIYIFSSVLNETFEPLIEADLGVQISDQSKATQSPVSDLHLQLTVQTTSSASLL
jgi:hypothetical protein